jgi:hypothetical protein
MVLKKQVVSMWTGLRRLRKGPVVSSCEHGNGHLGSIKEEAFLE